MAKRDEQRRINTRPEGSVQAASTLITASQVIGGSPNTLGGWVFGPASLGNSGIVLHSGGWIQVGVDDYTVRLDAIDAAYRMWAGAPLGADAPFSITVDGSLHAENAYIEGEIVAETGSIGGWTISSGLLSTGGVGLRPADYPFFAGDADPASAEFRVTAAGGLTATSATITGAITATSGDLGTLSVSGTLTLGASAIIKSTNYSENLAGWQIDYLGNAEFNNIHVRGTIDSAVFKYDEISAVSGSIIVTPTSDVLAVHYHAAGTMTVEGDGTNWTFATGDIVRIRSKDTLGVVREAWLSLTRTGTLNEYTSVVESGYSGEWPVGTAVLGYGQAAGGTLMMTAVGDLDGPRYSVLTHGADASAGEVEVARLGFLDNWQTYAGTDYGIAIGDYGTDGTDGNYLLYGTTAGFKMVAGDGMMVLDNSGMAMKGGVGVYESRSSLRWLSPYTGTDKILQMYAFQQNYGGGIIDDFSYIATGTEHGGNATLGISSQAPTGKAASANLKAQSGSVLSFITVAANDDDPAGEQAEMALTAEQIYLKAWGSPYTTEVEITGALTVTGDYKSYRNATTYTGYIFVPLTTVLTSTSFDGDLYDTDNDEAIIDLSAAFGLPAGIRAVSVMLWMTCPTVGKTFSIRTSSTSGGPSVAAYTQVANQQVFASGIVPCDTNGDIYFSTDAVHGAECAVYLRVNGYWI